MARKKPVSEQEALEATPPDSVETVSKAEAVRRAVAAGVESPTEGVAYVMKHFGIEMDNKTFSLNRSQQKTRDAKKGEAKGKPGRKPRVQGSGGFIGENGIAAPAPKIEAKGDGNLIDVLEQMKPLIAQHGAEKIKRLVDLLG